MYLANICGIFFRKLEKISRQSTST